MAQMADNNVGLHTTVEALISYFAGELPEDHEREIEEHLADCMACVALARRVNTLSHLWNQWTARSHGESYAIARISKALMIAGESTKSADLRERIGGWIDKLRLKAEAAVGIVMDSARQTVDFFHEGMEDLCRPQPLLQFQPAPAYAVRKRGTVRTRGTARTRGTLAEAREPVSITTEGTPRATVSLDAKAGTVTVTFDKLKKPYPLILLLPKAEDQKPILGLLERRNGQICAELKDVPDGEYVLLVEPLT
jgi:hypothetical protein